MVAAKIRPRFKLHWPWRNLGCPGITIGPYYGDLYYRAEYRHRWLAWLRLSWGLYLNDGFFRRRYRITWRGLKLSSVEDLDPDNCLKVYRRTMTPYKILTTDVIGSEVEAMSFPFLEDDTGAVKIMVRLVPGDCRTLTGIYCHRLRPIRFGWPWEKFSPWSTPERRPAE